MGQVPSYLLESFVEPWYHSLTDPEKSQRDALEVLLKGYAKTEYGERFGAAGVNSPEGYTAIFPVCSYRSLQPIIDEVLSGKESALLPEKVARWVMTRGSTGRPKLIPATETFLSSILSLGARAIVNFALKKRPSVLTRGVINLNFPSEVGNIASSAGGGPYGYSSGTYAKLNPGLGLARLVPRQEEIDALGSGIARADWEKRFELVYDRVRGEDIGCVMGVTPVILAFAGYLRRRHSELPRELWPLDAIFCTSVSKIQTKYSPQLRHYFGEVPVVEMYTATEGVFAQQMDDLPYLRPNYDAYFFEVRAGGRVRMLHQLRRGEWGSLIVSTPLFPRYEIGDLIEAQGKDYYRVIGRTRRLVSTEHVLFNILTGRPHLWRRGPSSSGEG
jgi:hypothetical protein